MEVIPIISGLLGLALTSAVLIAIPGPSVMFFIGQVVVAGRLDAAKSVVGNAIGMALIAVLVAFGLGVLITHSEIFLMAVRMAGAAILLLIGFTYVYGANSKVNNPDKAHTKKANPLVSGAIVGVTNPKGLIMFGTIVPSFLPTNITQPTFTLLLYSAIPIILGLIIDFVWVIAAHAITSRALFTEKNMGLIHALGGWLIIFMAVILAWEAISPLVL